MNQRVRDVIDHGLDLSRDYRRTRASLAAGGLAYFVALSIAPAALALGTVAGLLLDPEDIRAALERLGERTPDAFAAIEPVADALLSTVESASTSSFTIATIVSALVAVYAASKVVLGLRMAMNSAFGVVETRSGLIERGFAAIVTLIAIVVGVALIFILTVLPQILGFLELPSGPLTTGVPVLDWALVMLLILVVVRWLLQHGPDRPGRVRWHSLGAWTATLGIAGATLGVGLFTRYSSSISAAIVIFGTAIVLLLWVYLCFVSLLWGAVIEADAERRRGELTSPEPSATSEGATG